MTTWPQLTIDTNKYRTMCFGCGKENPIGLKLNFQWDGKTAKADFTPTEFYQGWPGVVHGGIIGCLLDEAMSYAVLFSGKYAVTAKMQIQLKRPAAINEPLIITSSVTKDTRKLMETKATVSLKDGTVVAEATGTHFVVSSKQEENKPKI